MGQSEGQGSAMPTGIGCECWARYFPRHLVDGGCGRYMGVVAPCRGTRQFSPCLTMACQSTQAVEFVPIGQSKRASARLYVQCAISTHAYCFIRALCIRHNSIALYMRCATLLHAAHNSCFKQLQSDGCTRAACARCHQAQCGPEAQVPSGHLGRDLGSYLRAGRRDVFFALSEHWFKP